MMTKGTDMQVIGIDGDGCLICRDESGEFNCGETVAEFGIENLTEAERLALQGI